MRFLPLSTVVAVFLQATNSGAQSLAPTSAPSAVATDTPVPSSSPVVATASSSPSPDASSNSPTTSISTNPTLMVEEMTEEAEDDDETVVMESEEPSAAPVIVATPVPIMSAIPAVADEATSIPSDTPSVVPSDVPSFAPSAGPTYNYTLSFASPECSVNGACYGLADNCCPTIDGDYLYCCFEEPPSDFFGASEVLLDGTGVDTKARYLYSTATYNTLAAAPDDSTAKAVSYTRNPDVIYDLIYYTIDISDPSEYINGVKKFYMDVFTMAPVCTEVLLQFDSLPLAGNAYPTGRYARFVAFTTASGSWERLEFDFLDQPHPTMDLSDNPVNSIVLLFAPGTTTSDTYSFRSLDSAIGGCDPTAETCESAMPKSCPAILPGETCSDGVDNNGDDRIDCADVLCAEDPMCVENMSDSLSTVTFQLSSPTDKTSSAFNIELSVVIVGMMALASIL